MCTVDIVVPERPKNIENLSEKQLQQLVSRDSIIGVAFASAVMEGLGVHALKIL